MNSAKLKETIANIVKEESEYQVFFKKALEKAGKSITDMSDDEKKAFFNKIDAAWDGKGEKNEGNAFGAAVVAAKEKGEDEFEVGGKTYKVEESVNEEEIKWNAVQNAIINFLKANTKILDKRVQAKDTEGVKGGLKSIINGLTNAQRSLKLESVNEASYVSGYTVKAKTPYEFVNGAYAVLSAYLRDEQLGPKGKRELQNTLKSLEYLRKYFFFNLSESVNEIKKGSVVIPYAMDKHGEFIVDKVFKNKSGETSYTGKFKKSGESREFILHSKDKVVKESVNEGVINELSADTYKNTVKAALQRGDSKGNSIAVKALQSFGKEVAKQLAGKSFEVKGSKDNLAKGFYRGNSQKFINQFKMTFTGEGELINSRDVKVFGSDEVHFRMKVEFQVPDNIGGFSTDVKFRGYEKYKFPGLIQFSIKQGRVWAWFNSADTELEFTRVGAREMAKLADTIVAAMDFPTNAKHNTIKQFDPMKVSESVNEAASRTAMEIGGLTGLNKDAVQKFVDTHNMDIEKVYQYVKKSKLTDRLNFVTAIVGTPGNSVQKKMIKMFGESINEGARIVLVNPNTNKFVKTVIYSGPNRDADKEVERLNAKLPNSQKEKGFYWKVSSFESVNEGRAFINAARKAKQEGKTEFEFNGKKYPVTLKEGTLNEMNPQLNKGVKSLLDKELKDLRKGGSNHLFAVMNILMGALTDANFHSESKKVTTIFGSKAKYEGDPMAQKDMESLYQSIGERIATMAKWDGEDIAKAVGFYVSMTIGRPLGQKIENLV